MRPKAAKWLIIVLRGLYPVFGKHPEYGEFILIYSEIQLYKYKGYKYISGSTPGDGDT